MEYYKQINEIWRVQGYRKAINTLRQQKQPVRTKQDALKLPGFGHQLSDKLEEIVKTGKLTRLIESKKDSRAAVLGLLEGIFGVGPNTAREWYNDGVRNLSNARVRPDLTPQQRVGIDRYHDFNTRIPRNEVAQHFSVVESAARNIDSGLRCFIMGSYRRGVQTCGDIDLIVTKPGTKRIEEGEKSLMWVLQKLTTQLTAMGFLKVCLLGKDKGGKDSNSKWYGASMLEDIGIWRRIDILIVPWSELGASLLYFTGNDLFNRSIRMLAVKKGMSLNQHGLFKDVIRDKNWKKIHRGTLVEAHDERKIFEALGIKWLEPKERNVG
ncbi:Nucleotidyltransferase [Nadsonia fulvescens var. elongata DSM 6958]|uniref:DNA polymerase n=1 Tax=Nadsonia fulvescens var. elongata DSM 6958 TaxID=857566 RepID=A0A1E3PG04_9ASCO|nr:Nucleotidyltransferase [Nadsonia fulvescens var. elongata DSM 6958]